jgi:hypothetical protein
MNIVDRFILELREFCKRNNDQKPRVVYIDKNSYDEILMDERYNDWDYFLSSTDDNDVFKNKIFGIPYVITGQVQGFQLK